MKSPTKTPVFASCVNCSGSGMRPTIDGQHDVLVCLRRGPFPVVIPQQVQTPHGAIMGVGVVSVYAPVSQMDRCDQHAFAKATEVVGAPV